VLSPPHRSRGLAWGALGVVAFSLTVPMTKVAVETMSPLLVGAGRAVIAAALAAAALTVTRQRRPVGRQWVRLAVVAGGVVAGFPLLTSYALTSVPASHGAMIIAVLPAATAVAAALRGHERPPIRFWAFAALGALAAAGFATTGSGELGGLRWADVLLLAAVVAAAAGYAEGGLLARELGAWQTISWALVLCAPVMAVLTGVAAAQQTPSGSAVHWAAFGYLSAVSAFLGFFAWYRGLAIGPMAQVSQVQLVQPVLTIAWAVALLGEQLAASTAIGAVAVVLCARAAVRTRLSTPTAATPAPYASV
jgi:drug/metabolite transporter (DMT)-like permease